MTKKLLVLMDAGRFKAFRWEESPRFSNPRLEPLEDWETEVNVRLSEVVTGQAGQFPKGSKSFAAINDMSDGERHNIDLELRRRALKKMAARIGELLDEEDVSGCYLAAGREINGTLLEELDPRVRVKVEKNVPSNLTRLDQSEIIEHFCEAGRHKSR